MCRYFHFQSMLLRYTLAVTVTAMSWVDSYWGNFFKSKKSHSHKLRSRLWWHGTTWRHHYHSILSLFKYLLYLPIHTNNDSRMRGIVLRSWKNQTPAGNDHIVLSHENQSFESHRRHWHYKLSIHPASEQHLQPQSSRRTFNRRAYAEIWLAFWDEFDIASSFLCLL